MDPAQEDAFVAFVAARSTALLRTAYLLVDTRDQAEDLLQTALVKTYLAWSRLRDPVVLEAYVRRTMATTAISWWRGRRFRERPVEQPPERAGPNEIDPRLERDDMWGRLRALPVKQRTVLVLRYYEGLNEAEIAEALGISRGTVKSHSARALNALRSQFEVESTGVQP